MSLDPSPISRLTRAIHFYGGDFFGAVRSEWDPETLLEQRYDDVEKNMRLFEEANAVLATPNALSRAPSRASKMPTRPRLSARSRCQPAFPGSALASRSLMAREAL